MGHYTGPKARISRRLGAMIFESNGARKAFERRSDGMPGMHQRRGKVSGYGKGMLEKQKIKHFYGLGERQLRRLYQEAMRRPGNIGENLLIMCELRFDNIVRRGGLTATRPQARQGIGHGHFLINGMKCDVASRLLKPGEMVHVKARGPLQQLYGGSLQTTEIELPAFLRFDASRLTIHIERAPVPDEISLSVNIGAVIELLSR